MLVGFFIALQQNSYLANCARAMHEVQHYGPKSARAQHGDEDESESHRKRKSQGIGHIDDVGSFIIAFWPYFWIGWFGDVWCLKFHSTSAQLNFNFPFSL